MFVIKMIDEEIKIIMEIVVKNKHAAKLEFNLFISFSPFLSLVIVDSLPLKINDNKIVYAAIISAYIAGIILMPISTKWFNCFNILELLIKSIIQNIVDNIIGIILSCLKSFSL